MAVWERKRLQVWRGGEKGMDEKTDVNTLLGKSE